MQIAFNLNAPYRFNSRKKIEKFMDIFSNLENCVIRFEMRGFVMKSEK